MKMKKSKHLIYFFISAVIVFLVVLNLSESVFFQGYVNKIFDNEFINKKNSAESPDFIINDCNLNKYTDKKFNNYSINNAVLSKLITQGLNIENQNSSDICDKTKKAVSRVETADLLVKTYEKLKNEEIQIDAGLAFSDLPQISEIENLSYYEGIPKELIFSVYKLYSMKEFKQNDGDEIINFYPKVSASKEWAETLIKNIAALIP